MPDVDSLLCKEIARTRGINPVLLIELVGRYGPGDREAARDYLVKDKKMSESLADKAAQGLLVYWHRADREKRRRRDLL